ncbi:MAG: hypothetical protein AAFR89_05245, partial [Cyanobacteria bacterium J06633_1]
KLNLQAIAIFIIIALSTDSIFNMSLGIRNLLKFFYIYWWDLIYFKYQFIKGLLAYSSIYQLSLYD